LAKELARQKGYLRDVERTAAAARTATRAAEAAAARAQQELGRERRAREQETSAAAAELQRTRQRVRWARGGGGGSRASLTHAMWTCRMSRLVWQGTLLSSVCYRATWMDPACWARRKSTS
jgi:hypothetical protein